MSENILVKMVDLAGQWEMFCYQEDACWLNPASRQMGNLLELTLVSKVAFSGEFSESEPYSEWRPLQLTPALQKCSGDQQGGHQRAWSPFASDAPDFVMLILESQSVTSVPGS